MNSYLTHNNNSNINMEMYNEIMNE